MRGNFWNEVDSGVNSDSGEILLWRRIKEIPPERPS